MCIIFQSGFLLHCEGGKYSALCTNSVVYFTERFSSLNIPWSQRVWISDFQLYMPVNHCTLYYVNLCVHTASASS